MLPLRERKQPKLQADPTDCQPGNLPGHEPAPDPALLGTAVPALANFRSFG